MGSLDGLTSSFQMSTNERGREGEVIYTIDKQDPYLKREKKERRSHPFSVTSCWNMTKIQMDNQPIDNRGKGRNKNEMKLVIC